jgi:hypothetical protein
MKNRTVLPLAPPVSHLAAEGRELRRLEPKSGSDQSVLLLEDRPGVGA